MNEHKQRATQLLGELITSFESFLECANQKGTLCFAFNLAILDSVAQYLWKFEG
jgi:hypothetical protein